MVSSDFPLRYNLELYQSDQLSKLVGVLSDYTGISANGTERILSEFIEFLERGIVSIDSVRINGGLF